jgi:hypothetical protein
VLRPYALAARTGAVAESFSRLGASITNLGSTVLTSGQQLFVGIPMITGQVVTAITFVSGTTALAGGSNQWFSLYDATHAKLQVTSDDTSTAWAANTAKTLTLASPYTIPSDGIYYAGIMVNATTVPSLLGVGSTAVITALAPQLTVKDSANTGLTNPASAPAFATFGTTGSYCYAYFT